MTDTQDNTHQVSARDLENWTGYAYPFENEMWSVEGAAVEGATVRVSIAILGNRVKAERRIIAVPADTVVTVHSRVPRSIP